MRRNFLYRTLVSATLTALFTGCAAEHKKFVKSHEEGFASTRLSMLYQAADQQYKVGDLSKCRDSIRGAMEADPKHPFAPLYVLAGRVELEGGSLEVAATDLKKAIELDGKNAEAFYLLGVVYQRWQKFDEAADYYKEAADKKPGEATAVIAEAEMRIALGQLDEAKQFLSDKMFYFEQSAAMRIALARIASLQGDKAGAARNYRDAAMLLPDDKNLQFTYALALVDAGKYSDASKILEQLRYDPPVLPKAPKAEKDAAENEAQAAISTKVSLLMTLGECYVNLGRPLDARDCFQEAIRAQPTNASAFLSLGKACLMTGDYNLVIEAADRVLRIEPQSVDAMILQAAVQQKQKKWSDSMTTLAGAAKISPKDPTVLCMAGISAIQLGKKDIGTQFFEQALAAHPGDAWASELLESVRPATPASVPPAPSPSAAAPLAEPAAVAEDVQPILGAEPFALTLCSEAAGIFYNSDTQMSAALATGTERADQ
jgi:tetratricopeptide (TPR) repeat protein